MFRINASLKEKIKGYKKLIACIDQYAPKNAEGALTKQGAV